MYHQVVQLLTGARLIARAQGASIKELQEHLGISRKTVYRLFDALEELGYMLYPDMVGREARYYLNKELEKMRYWQPLPFMSFDVEDRVLLDFMFRKISENRALSKPALSLRNKLAMAIADYGYSIAEKNNGPGKSLVSRPVIVTDIPIGKKSSEVLESVIPDILQAIREKTVCLISYKSLYSGTLKTYQVHPLTLFEHNGGLYAYVYQPFYGKVIIIAMERIHEFELINEKFNLPEGYDAEKRLSDPFGIVLEDETFVARIKFSTEQAPYIQERLWPEGTGIEILADSSIILNIATAGAYELKKWILGFGDSAELLEPEWLREQLADDISRLSDVYQ